MAKFFSTSSSSVFTGVCLATVFILSALFFGASEWLIAVHVVPKDYEIKRAGLFHARPHLNTVWGDSQMRDGVNMLEGFMNFSSGSQTYSEIEAKMKAYYEGVNEPFKVVLQAAINNFASYRDRPNRAEVQHFFVENHTNGPFMMTPYFQETAWRYWKNFFENGMEIQGDGARFNPDGSTSQFGDYSAWEDPKKTRHIHDNIEGYMPLSRPKDLEAYQSLRRIFEYLQDKGAQVCFVTTPMQDDVKGALLKHEEARNVERLFRDLAGEFGVRYVNFLNESYPDHVFDDTSHLNVKGAGIFTKAVSERCF